MKRGVYPGTFNPPTVGHLAIVEATLRSFELEHLDLVVSRRPLGKSSADRPTLEHRVEVIEASVAHLEMVSVQVTELRLIADIAETYDVVVMGADKWTQVNDVRFYASRQDRDRALGRLPTVAVAARGDEHVPPHLSLRLEADLHQVSSSEARGGATHLMTEAAQHFDTQSGAWTDPQRYEAFLSNTVGDS